MAHFPDEPNSNILLLSGTLLSTIFSTITKSDVSFALATIVAILAIINYLLSIDSKIKNKQNKKPNNDE